MPYKDLNKRKEYFKKYHSTPEAKRKKKEYYQRPEVRKHLHEYNRKRRLMYKEEYNNYAREWKYKITNEEFENMLKLQNYRCAICDKELHKVYVDHDHKIGKVRGLLCLTCNLMLGLVKDKVLILSKAIEYLEKVNKSGS